MINVQSNQYTPQPRTITPSELAESPLVVDANGFGCIPWSQALDEARGVTVEEARELLEGRLLFEEADRRVARVSDPTHVPQALWFIGDLHGDLLAMVNAWHYIEERSKADGHEPRVLFLGDFVDRGVYSHETLLYLFVLIRNNPGRVGVLPGNHDKITWDEGAQQFRSEVNPAEYTDGLNAILAREPRSQEDQERVELGKIACAFFAKRPCAVFLPDGLLLAHAGFPHADLLESLKVPDDLSSAECLQDYLWLRVSENAPRKRPNRGTKGCEFGYENFSDFCRIASQVLGIPTLRMLRGHEHPPERYATYPKYRKNPILTINTMCRRLDDELSLRVEQFPLACVARYVPGRLPEVHRLPIAHGEIRAAYFPEPGSTDADTCIAVESTPATLEQ
jgi:hypothetical protein